MFILHSPKAQQTILHGCNNYKKLFSRFIGITLKQQQYTFAPFNMTFLMRPDYQDAPLIVKATHQTAILIGKPSCLMEDGGDVFNFVQSGLDHHYTLDQYLQALQGHYILILIDQDTQNWQLAVDGVGLSRLYYHQSRLLFSDTLYLLASCIPLQFDPIGCATLELCGYALGSRTIFEDVRQLEMTESIQGTPSGWQLGRSWHFADYTDTTTDIEMIAAAYQDAAQVRLAEADTIRHCMTGGTDSRIVAALLSSLRLEPTLFSFRWDREDTRIAQDLANEVGFNFQSVSKQRWFGGNQCQSLTAEIFLLDGALPPPLQKRNYLFDLTPQSIVTSGHYGGGTVKTTLGIGYAGMHKPTPAKIINRLISSAFIKSNHKVEAFVTDPLPMVRDYLQDTLSVQANLVGDVPAMKLCIYFDLCNFGARWAAGSLAAANRITNFEFPLSYLAGLTRTWGLPASEYRNLKLTRTLLWLLDQRLSHYPFSDGTPATSDYHLKDYYAFVHHRYVQKGISYFNTHIMNKKSKKLRGTMRSEYTITQTKPLREIIPRWVLKADERRTGVVYHPKRTGNLKYIYALEFAARLYDTETILEAVGM